MNSEIVFYNFSKMSIVEFSKLPYIEIKAKTPEALWNLAQFLIGDRKMVMLSDDEAALIKAILVALRGIKMKEIDRALVILSKNDRRQIDR